MADDGISPSHHLLNPQQRHAHMDNAGDSAHYYTSHRYPQNDPGYSGQTSYSDISLNQLSQVSKSKQAGQPGEVVEEFREVDGGEPPLESPLEVKVVRYRPGAETYLADFLCLAVPIGLLIFTILLITKNGQKADTTTINQWKNAASILSTLFPLLFAAVVGRLMTQAARCQLESGSTIGTLEQLLGSRTVGGTVITQYSLRAFNILGIILLLLWCISPLGSQATLRLVEVRDSSESSSRPMMFFDTVGASPSDYELPPYREHEAAVQNATFDRLNGLYNSAILAPISVKSSTMDLWGNVKIPFLPSWDSNKRDEWQKVESGTESSYSSLIGLPIMNVPTGNTTFEAESTYIELDCGILESTRSDTGPGRPTLNGTWLARLSYSSDGPPPNGTFQGFRIGGNGSIYNDAPWTFAIDRMINFDWLYNTSRRSYSGDYQTEASLKRLEMFQNETGIEAGATNLFFEAYPSSALTQPLNYLGTTCSVKQRYVASQITCSRREQEDQKNCSVTAQRPSHKYTMPESLSILNFPEALYMISKFWPVSSGPYVARIATQDITLQYLTDPSLTQSGTLGTLTASTNGSTALSRRLSQALNSYVQISSMDTSTLRLDDSGSSALGKNQTADAIVESPITIFHVPTVWIAISLVSCLILLVSGAGSIYFVHRAIGPEVLGYVTSAVRNSSLIELSDQAKKMDGLDLALQLRQTRVRFGMLGTSVEDTVVGVGEENRTTRLRDMTFR